MRFCGIDVAAREDAQQLVTLHARRGAEGARELVATVYAPGDPAQVAATVIGFGGEAVVCVDAPAGRRLDLLAPGSALRDRLGLPAGRYEEHRVGDALLHRRGLPLWPVPRGERAAARWEAWLREGYAVHAALDPLGAWRPTPADGAVEGDAGGSALRFGRVAEAHPDAVFAVLLGHRPGSRRTPAGLQQRIAALRLRGVVDADGGLWQRSASELDACALAYAAATLAGGSASWAGDPREGVVVLPAPLAALRGHHARLPAPARVPLASAPTGGASRRETAVTEG
jgi:hypothetical protein